MSASGPLLPTVSQGDQGGSPLDSVPPISSQEKVLVPSPSSAITSPLISPSKNSSKDEEEKGNASPSATKLQNPSLERDGSISFSQKENLLLPSQSSPGKKNEYHGHPLSSREEKSNSSRDWNATYSEMFQDEGGGDGPAFVESDDDAGGTPKAVRWAKSLRNLLEDEVGANIFRSYLLQELRTSDVVDFWYACKGLRENEARFENINELIQVIWKKFLRSHAVQVSRSTYESIKARIDRFDPHIFDQAQCEVEKQMNETLYRSFLESDLYLSFLLPDKRGGGGGAGDSSPSPPLPSDSFCPLMSCGNNFLPTLHEDSEYDARGNQPSRLTTNNLLASASYRAHSERIKPEGNAGFYLKGSSSYNPSPYHIVYVAGHTVSLQDSELQSLSSGTHTDDTKSYTDSSLDASSLSLSQPMNRKHLRRQTQKMIENALQNREPHAISSISGVQVIPRTMLDNQSNAPRASTNPKEFMRVLTEKLEKYQQEKDTKERLNQSMCKIAHSEGAPEEIRREHAVNALPPNVLLNKLTEKVQFDEQDPCQSILDEHCARVWDSPICSPFGGESPPNKATKGNVTRPFPHLIYPNSLSPTTLSAHMVKCALKSSRYTNVPTTASSPSAMHPNLTQSVLGARGRYTAAQGFSGYSGQLAHGNQSKSAYHGRRKERGQDVYSTFSSDSGNVADYHDSNERVLPSHLPKSKSMPEYIENHSCATSDASNCGNRRHIGSGTRRCCRRPPADCTDSGVSVVSDSGRSGAPSSSSERVESWLFHSRPFTSSNTSHSVCPGGEREVFKEFQKAKGSRSTHTIAGSTSPGMQRKGGGSSGRRSQCSSSTSGNTCINIRPDMLPLVTCQMNRPDEMSRDSPLGQAQPSIIGDRKKHKGGSSSSKSTGHSSSFEGSGSNGSTLKKQQKSLKSSGECIPTPHAASQGTIVPNSSADVTTIVYSFQDEHVPFIIKVPSRPVTLKKFKQHLHKKGSFRYFFKKFCEDMGMVYEEITDDGEILPLFEGKVFVQIHKDD